MPARLPVVPMPSAELGVASIVFSAPSGSYREFFHRKNRVPCRDLSVRLAVILLVSMVATPVVWAGEPWQPISAEELAMTSEPKAPGAPAIFLYRQVDRDDSQDREFNYVRIKILTEEGRKYADVEIPFVKQQWNVHGIKARTIQPNGAIEEFNGKIYEKTVVKAKGIKFLAKTFTLPNVGVGTIIEYAYSSDMDSSYVFDSHWILSAELFTKKGKFSLKPNRYFSLRCSWPIGLPEGTPAPTKQGTDVHLEVQNVAAFHIEDYMPPENALKYRVEFVYSRGTPEMDVVKFWKQQDKEWYAVFDNFTNKRHAMEQAITQIVSPSDSPEVKLQKIYARVLQVRNTSFEREKTEQEAKREKQKEINNVEDVWQRGYGSARAINWLFIALARSAGIEAETVFVPSRNSYFFNSKLMNPYLLNTDVVLAKVPGRELYLDPGSKFAPFGFLPWFETQVQGLALDKDGGRWVETAFPDSSSAKTERQAVLTLAEDGTLEGKLTVTFGGLESIQMRTEERDEDELSRKTFLENLIKEAVPVGIDVELTNKPDWAAASPTLVAEYHLRVLGWVSGAGRRALFPVGLFGSSEKHVFEHAHREHSIYFHHAYLKSDDITVTLPLGWKVASVPVPIDQDAKAVAYIVKSEGTSGSLHIRRTLRSELAWLDRGQYELLRHFFQLVRTGDEEQVVLQPIH